MPRKKEKRNEFTDREQAHIRAEKAREYVGQIADDFTAKANAGNLSQQEFERAIEALRQIVASPHITGITATTPRISVTALDRSNLIVKVSISTKKTRVEFSVRKRL